MTRQCHHQKTNQNGKKEEESGGHKKPPIHCRRPVSADAPSASLLDGRAPEWRHSKPDSPRCKQRKQPPPPLQHTTAHASKRTGFSNGSRGEDDDDEDAARRPSTAPAGACRAVTERAREKANMSDAVAATVSLTSGKEARRGEEGEKKKSAQWGSSAGVARDDQAGRRGRARNRSGAVRADARGTGGT